MNLVRHLFFLLASLILVILAAEYEAAPRELINKLVSFEGLLDKQWTDARPAIVKILHEIHRYPRVGSLLNRLERLVYKFILDGDVEMLYWFEKAGYSAWSDQCLGFLNNPLQANKIQVLMFLSERGLDMVQASPDIFRSIRCSNFTIAQFDFLLRRGLQLNYDVYGMNWLDISLFDDNTDLAYFLYNNGLRPNNRLGAAYNGVFIFERNKRTLIRMVTIDMGLLLLVGSQDDGSSAHGLALEIVAREITPLLYLLYMQN